MKVAFGISYRCVCGGGGGSHHGGSIRASHPVAPGLNLCIDTTDLPTIETTNKFTTLSYMKM